MKDHPPKECHHHSKEQKHKRHSRRMAHFMMNRHHTELKRYRSLLHIMPFLIIVLIILMIAVLYKWSGQENFTTLIVGLFVFLLIKEVLQAIFFKKISTKFIEPLIKLKEGFDKIADGDYDTRIQCSVHGEMQVLCNSFNGMAAKLKENEELKQQYAENRKLLIANISHDLKTPITSVQGYLEVLDEGIVNDPEKLSKYVRVIKSNTEYMNRLINDLFLFSKLDIDQVSFEFQNVKAAPFINDMMQEFELILNDYGVDFKFESEVKAESYMNVDGKRLHQAIRNIVENAVKYGSSENPEIYVLASSTDENVSLTISDNGSGIPEDKLVNVFDRFFRLEDERTKDTGSTGLGLAITKELIVAHGGDIIADNSVEGGARFIITLPITNEKEGLS